MYYMPIENQKILTVDGIDFVIRWRSMIDRPNFPGVNTLGFCYTGTIGAYRLPHLHKTIEDLLFTAFEWAKTVATHPGYLENCLGKPDDLEAFLA